MKEISLVITVSRLDFLKEALVSIGAQQSHDFELIVVVDISKISSEETVAMVNSICNHPASRTKFCFINGNGSAGRVRNAGFSMAKTRWISYMDDDDIITPDALKTVIEAIPGMEKDQVGFFSSGIFSINEHGKEIFMPKSLDWMPPRGLYSGNPKCINSPIYFNQFQTIKMEEWRKYPFHEEMGEDLDYVMHHLLLSKFKKIPQYLYGYRQNKNSFSRALQLDLFTKRYQNGYYYLLLKKNDNKYAKNNLI